MSNFLIISHVFHVVDSKKITAYAPYVREMNLWSKYVDNVIIIAPIAKTKLSNIIWK